MLSTAARVIPAPPTPPRRAAHALRPLLFAALLGLASTASALPPIEQQMTPEQFKAAGLDKLSADQLRNLNSWLGRTVETATSQARDEARKSVETEHRGFLSFGSSEPIASRISGEFRGLGRGRSYTLANGQVWQQVDEATLAGVRKESPAVTISPSLVGNAWYIAIEGYNTRAKVQRIK